MSTSEQRATAIVMISVLANQLLNWASHAKDLGYATKEFKFELSKTQAVIKSLLAHMGKVTTTQDNEDFFELSAQYSDMVEKIISINNEDDLNEVMALIESKLNKN